MKRKAVVRNVTLGALATGLVPLTAAGAGAGLTSDSAAALCRATFGDRGPAGGRVVGEGPSGDPMVVSIGWDPADWSDDQLAAIVTCVSADGRPVPSLTTLTEAPPNTGSLTLSLTLPPGAAGSLVCEQSVLVGKGLADGRNRTTSPVCFKLRGAGAPEPGRPGPAGPPAPVAPSPAPPDPGRGAAGPPAPPTPGRGAAGQPAPPTPGRGAAGPPAPPTPGRGAAGQPAPPTPGRGAAGQPAPPTPGRGAAGSTAPATPDPASTPPARAAFEAAASPARPSAARAASAPARKPVAGAVAAEPAVKAPAAAGGAPDAALASTGIEHQLPLAGAGALLAFGGAAILFAEPRRRSASRSWA
jgi:hypothetical protein